MEYVKKQGLIVKQESNRVYLDDDSEFCIQDNYLSIHVHEEHRGHGLAAWMIYLVLSTIEDKGQWYKIDGDASNGFWDYVGMHEGRYGYMVYTRPPHSCRWKDTEGGEKSITHASLWKWAKERNK